MKFGEWLLNEDIGNRVAFVEYYEKDGKQMVRITINNKPFEVTEEEFKTKFKTWQKGINNLSPEDEAKLEQLKNVDAGAPDLKMVANTSSISGDSSKVIAFGDDKK